MFLFISRSPESKLSTLSGSDFRRLNKLIMLTSLTTSALMFSTCRTKFIWPDKWLLTPRDKRLKFSGIRSVSKICQCSMLGSPQFWRLSITTGKSSFGLILQSKSQAISIWVCPTHGSSTNSNGQQNRPSPRIKWTFKKTSDHSVPQRIHTQEANCGRANNSWPLKRKCLTPAGSCQPLNDNRY